MIITQEALGWAQRLGPVLVAAREELLRMYARSPYSTSATREEEARAWALVNCLQAAASEVKQLASVLVARQGQLAACEEGGNDGIQ